QVRSGRFSVVMCTAGDPGEPTCPTNVVALDLGTSAGLRFVARPAGDGLELSMVRILPGAQGVYFEHPRFELYPAGSTTPLPAADTYAGVTGNAAPDAATARLANSTLDFVNVPDGLGLVLDVFGPYRPLSRARKAAASERQRRQFP